MALQERRNTSITLEEDVYLHLKTQNPIILSKWINQQYRRVFMQSPAAVLTAEAAKPSNECPECFKVDPVNVPQYGACGKCALMLPKYHDAVVARSKKVEPAPEVAAPPAQVPQ